MSYVLKEQLAAAGNYGGSRSAEQILYLVIHYTGNDGDSAINNATYFQNNVVKASAHYFVDDTTVYRSVPELKVAWAVGGTLYSDVKETGGGSMYGIITNSNSLSVELCDTQKDGSYQASESTLNNAAILCRELMARYEIPVSNVYRHFDVTGKHCPSYFIDETAWQGFKSRLTTAPELPQEAPSEISITQEQFVRMLEHWLSRRAKLAPSSVSEEARQWAEESGILAGFSDGSKQYKSFCTREQMAIMLHRFWSLLQKQDAK